MMRYSLVVDGKEVAREVQKELLVDMLDSLEKGKGLMWLSVYRGDCLNFYGDFKKVAVLKKFIEDFK
ncbi:hypothetical protein BKH46_08370 [Helicobacter sp. 12S02634-8]|uniref:hypothetical protein n=1 Tax=Helicobacter sp. 12S02634-8 TaxID=1476199 RepID=UPI000BA74999|nr:hypothetical protein [Helicobacter sp. 12S02634-8]PAF46245.1 hypothetical protein BKH46_08370 [Helicobacter sp. 12S02634-8]